jgi:hypothetical protein
MRRRRTNPEDPHNSRTVGVYPRTRSEKAAATFLATFGCGVRECHSNDIFTLVRVTLEAAVRSEADLIELLPPDVGAMSALPRRTDVASGAGYVG